jgi:hypothetical protein
MNDAYGSNGEDAFVYWINTKEPLLLDDVILGQDKEAKTLAETADHAYFQVGRWVSANKLLVEYCGHNGTPPGQQFDIVFEVTIDGSHRTRTTSRRVSGKIGTLTDSTSECTF